MRKVHAAFLFTLIFFSLKSFSQSSVEYGVDDDVLAFWKAFEEMSFIDPGLGHEKVLLSIQERQTAGAEALLADNILIGFLLNLERADDAEKLLKKHENNVLMKDYPIYKGTYLRHYANFYRVKGDAKKSFELVNQSLEILEALNSKPDIADALQIRSFTNISLGDNGKALEDIIAAHELQKAFGDKPSQASTLQSIATIYTITGFPEKALEYYEEAITLLDPNKHQYMLSMMYFSLGNGYNNIGDTALALVYLEKTLSISKELNDTSTQGYVYHELGKLYGLEKKFTRSCENYLEALNIFGEAGDNRVTMLMHTKIASCQSSLENFALAERHMSKALGLIGDISHWADKVKVFDTASRVYERQGSFQTALDYHKRYTESVIGQQKANREQELSDLQIKYDTVQKQERNEQLKNENALKQKLLEQQRQKQQNLIGLLSLSGVLILVVMIAFYKQMTNRRKTEALLREKETLANELDLANAKKNQFLAAVSHDIRQPLQALVYLTDCIDSNSDVSVDNLKKTVTNLNQLVNTIFDISKLDNDVIRTDVQTIDGVALLKDVRDTYHPLAESKSIDLQCQSESFWLNTDAHLFKHIVGIILDNAIKHSGARNIWLTTRIEGSNNIIVTVTDNGKGIAETEWSHIFDEFYQVENHHRDRKRGMGLGLALAKRLADLLNISISLRAPTSHQGISFELHMVAAEAPDQSVSAIDGAKRMPFSSGLHVWVVDDDIELTDAMAQLLDRWKITYDIFNDTAAFDMPLKGMTPPDFIIADYRLPGPINGNEVIKKIHKYFGYFIEAIIVTGDLNIQDENIDVELIRKPIDTDVLYRYLTSIYSVKSQPGENS